MEINWVKALAECSYIQMFEHLKLGVESDVKIRNQLRQGEPVIFRMEQRAGTFSAHREENKSVSSVYFSLGPSGEIMITHDGVTLGIATPTLNNEGQCRLLIDGEELEEWQVRKLVLEKLFFSFKK